MFEKKQFNHDSDDFIEALGYTEGDHKHVAMTATYEILKPQVTAAILFESKDEMPDGFSSKSKIFEALIDRYANNPERTAIAYLIFEVLYYKLRKSLEELSELNDRLGGKESKREKRSFTSLEDMIRDIAETMKLKKIHDMVHFLKEINMDYNKFMAKALTDSFTPDEQTIKMAKGDGPIKGYKGLDDLLKDLMSESDEDEDDEE